MGDPKRGGVAPLKDCMSQFLRQAGLDRGLRDARVLGAWRKAVGPGLAPHARAVRFRTGELIVEVQSAAHHHELSSFTGEGFRRAANQQLGAETIRRVTFRLKQ